MELTNFGSIMKFALDRESEVKAILEQASGNKNLSAINGKVAELAALNQGNVKLLERTRRENICEMVLHPITGLNFADYIFSTTSAAAISESEFSSLLADVSNKLSRFYSEAGEKLPADEAKRVFLKLAKKRYFEA